MALVAFKLNTYFWGRTVLAAFKKNTYPYDRKSLAAFEKNTYPSGRTSLMAFETNTLVAGCNWRHIIFKKKKQIPFWRDGIGCTWDYHPCSQTASTVFHKNTYFCGGMTLASLETNFLVVGRRWQHLTLTPLWWEALVAFQKKHIPLEQDGIGGISDEQSCGGTALVAFQINTYSWGGIPGGYSEIFIYT